MRTLHRHQCVMVTGYCLDISENCLSLLLSPLFLFPSSIHTCTHSLWLATASENQPIIPHLQGKQCGRGFRLYDCHFSLHFPPTTTAYCPSTYEHTYNRQGMRGSTRLDKARTDGHEARSNFSPDKTTLSAPTTIQNTLCGVQRVARERARHELQAHLK